MQQQMYSGAEYAPNTVPYVTNDMQGPRMAQDGIHGPRQMVPSQVPSGYPAYALPGARFPMRGPGPSQAIQGQPYGGQQQVMQMGTPQTQISMQAYGPHTPIPSGPFPRQAAPPAYSGVVRNNHPACVPHHQGCQTPESSQRFMTGARYPGSTGMVHRYPGYGNPNQGTHDAYNAPHQSAQVSYPANYYQPRPGYHTNENYAYYSQNSQYQRNTQGSQPTLDPMVRHQHGFPNTMSASNNVQMHHNPNVTQNTMYGTVRGPINQNIHPNQYQMYPQYNNPHLGSVMQPGQQSSQMTANHGVTSNRAPASAPGTAPDQVRYFNNQENQI